ncbi:MAG: FAD:protein FMN transferase [Oscillospiraceae bacterium]|nr:FAD:protein FMN transferase [Oscillospiraceae bacterium]
MKRLFCAVLACLLLSGCGWFEQKADVDFWCMDTFMNVKLWGSGAEKAAGELQTMMNDLHTTWSAANEQSLLGKLNVGMEVALTDEQQAVLDRAQALSRRTGGAFDPKMRAVSRAWGFYNLAYRVPEQADIDAALALEQWDLGAAMKGYAGEKAAAYLEQTGVDRGILSLGGNIQTYGEKPDGTPWQIAIQNPYGEDALGIISVQGTKSVVTSGSYQRCFEANGQFYHHILDPETGYPADSGLVSVTVICDEGMTADALSTALFVMGLEDGVEFWRSSDDFEAVFVTEDGGIYATAGVALSGCSYEVIQ